MEQFTLLEGDHTLKDSRELINNALLTVRSLSAGDAFPTTDLSEGMLCYRTDLKRLYRLSDAEEGIWTDKLPADLDGTADTAGAVAWANVTGKPSAYPAESHTHSYAGASSAGGAATSAVKLATARTINGISFDGTKNITIVNSVAQGGTGASTAENARTNLGLSTAVTAASISGKTITLTLANGTTQTLTTQDTNTSNWSISKAAKGYAKDNTTGLILQWGSFTSTYNTSTTTTFNTAFTAAPIVMLSSNFQTSAGNKADSLALTAVTATNFTVYNKYESGSPTTATIYWFAIGY